MSGYELVFFAIGLLWVFVITLLATVASIYLTYVGFTVMVRSSKNQNEEVRVKLLPVTWGREKDRREVRVSVG